MFYGLPDHSKVPKSVSDIPFKRWVLILIIFKVKNIFSYFRSFSIWLWISFIGNPCSINVLGDKKLDTVKKSWASLSICYNLIKRNLIIRNTGIIRYTSISVNFCVDISENILEKLHSFTWTFLLINKY